MNEKILKEILDIIDAIPERMCGHPQPIYLYELSKKTKGLGAIVEIGTCAGKSTIALAYAQEQKNGMKINTIDIVEHPEIEKNLKRAGVSEFVNRILQRSSVLAVKWYQPIELLWIDGDHRYNGIVSDIKSWSKFVVTGGIMAFHDYPGFDGVNETWKAVYRYVLSKPEEWKVISDREAGSIIAFERLKREQISITRKQVLLNRMKWRRNNLKWYFEEFQYRVKK